MITRPDPTSMSGLALRVRAILPPAMIRPSTATAAASGSIHCCRRLTAGWPARSGDGTLTHQVMLLVTIHDTPDWIAEAIPLSASLATVPAAAPAAAPITWPSRQAGSIRTGHDTGAHPCPGKTVYPASEVSRVAALPQSPPGGATTRQSPPDQTTSTRVDARMVAPWLPGPALTRSTVASAGLQPAQRNASSVTDTLPSGCPPVMCAAWLACP